MRDTYKPETWWQMMKRHEGEKLERITEAINSGMSVAEAAREMECDAQSLHWVCKKNGISWPRMTGIGSPKWKRRKEMVEAGFTIEFMAKKEGLSANSLRAYFSKHGIEWDGKKDVK